MRRRPARTGVRGRAHLARTGREGGPRLRSRGHAAFISAKWPTCPAHMSAPPGSGAGSARWTSRGRAGTAAQRRARGRPGGPSHRPARRCLGGHGRPCQALVGRAGQAERGQSRGSRTGQWPRAGHGASIAVLGAAGRAWSTDGQSGRRVQRGQGHQRGQSRPPQPQVAGADGHAATASGISGLAE